MVAVSAISKNPFVGVFSFFFSFIMMESTPWWTLSDMEFQKTWEGFFIFPFVHGGSSGAGVISTWHELLSTSSSPFFLFMVDI